MKRLQQRIFQRASSTYYYSSLFFPNEVRDDVFILYAFVRVADDFVDAIPQDKQGLSGYRRQTDLAFSGKKVDNSIIVDFVEMCLRRDIPKKWVHDFLECMQSDLKPVVYTTYPQLYRYIYGSAEVIGLMMAQIMQLPMSSHPGAKLVGRCMQLINFVRDVQEDQQLGRQYLPGIQKDPELAIRSALLEYRAQVRAAQKSLATVPVHCRIPIYTALSMYNWVAAQIEEKPQRVWRGKIKPNKVRVMTTLCALAIREYGREVWSISRPRFWLYLAGPWLVGWAAGSTLPQHFLLPFFWYGLFFFLIPANILLYGMNDLHDSDTDVLSEKKNGYEQKVLETNQDSYRTLIVTSVVLAIPLLLFSQPLTLAFLLLFFALSIGYSVPPWRLKARAGWDCISNVLYILPGLAAFSQQQQTWPGIAVILASWAWVAAMQLFSAIPDIQVDRSAGLQTTAVVLGRSRSLLLCAGLWFCSVILVATVHPLFWLGLVYPAICLALIGKPSNQDMRAYKVFPALNGLVGFGLFWWVLYTTWQTRIWLPLP